MLRICTSMASMLLNPSQPTDFQSTGQSRSHFFLDLLSLPGFWDTKLTWFSSPLTGYSFSVSFAGSSSSLQPLNGRASRGPLGLFSFVPTPSLIVLSSLLVLHLPYVLTTSLELQTTIFQWLPDISVWIPGRHLKREMSLNVYLLLQTCSIFILSQRS